MFFFKVFIFHLLLFIRFIENVTEFKTFLSHLYSFELGFSGLLVYKKRNLKIVAFLSSILESYFQNFMVSLINP